MKTFFFFTAMLALGARLFAEEPLPAKIDYNHDVRPILSDLCFKCHGFDDKTREAGRRLDTAEGAFAEKDGVRAIVPGKLTESDLYLRIHSTDKDDAMPQIKSGKKLSERQKAILDRWIEQGAPYAKHWAFEPVRQVPPPTVKSGTANPIDAFIQARLDTEGLAPSPEADPYTLCRRLYLDLIGLPPTPEQADRFVAAAKVDEQKAVEQLVDLLLAAPQYGERWARRWLDLARYADTNGYEKDRPRSIWPWRDWVINALNADLPFDQFTIEQLAGDLLPHPTADQIIATGFHRNTMLNEEGGIDPLEFRFAAMTDRVATTGTTWMGMTIGCAQCHTHKYDPILHREYYQLMAFLDNADEPTFTIPPKNQAETAARTQEKIAKLIAELPGKFPIDARAPEVPAKITVKNSRGEAAEKLPDGSWRFDGPGTERETYTVTIETAAAENIESLRLDVLPDPKLPGQGPGRSATANFVLTNLGITSAPLANPGAVQPVKISAAKADFSQDLYPVEQSIDDNPATGWGIAGKATGVAHWAKFTFQEPIAVRGGVRLVAELAQNFGTQHTIGHFRVSLGGKAATPRSAADQPAALNRAFGEWAARESANVVRWTALRPATATSNLPLLTVLDDLSILASGDQTKTDTYELDFRALPKKITAVRLEVLPDDSLPQRGPGRVYYEGPAGDFTMTNFTAEANGKPAKFGAAAHSFAAGNFPASAAIDDNLQSGWSVDGGQGRAHSAVFKFAAPLDAVERLRLSLQFARHFSADLGRFRISITDDPRATFIASEMPPDIEKLFLLPEVQRSAAQRQMLFEHFLSVAPELKVARAPIDELRKARHAGPTTLVMKERPPENPRPTFLHKRGEFLQLGERVQPGVPSVLPPLPPGVPADRLAFARWLVSPQNPLTARVTVNRQWAILFGQGIVKTTEDFGQQGAPPTHPDLLDWLAADFMKNGWSMKKLHRLILTSKTYRQTSVVSPELFARDPQNLLLARGPRGRLEAEQVRDATLSAAGLLSLQIGGPSVYPPQPEGVSETAYGQPKWNASSGQDRYRRGLYTFAKRTAPFAMLNTFDGPTGEACLARREISNNPLQALTLLNDVVFMEAAQALGKSIAEVPGSTEDRVRALFRRVLTRPPTVDEVAALTAFFAKQNSRFAQDDVAAQNITGEAKPGQAERAAWTALARAIFNLDEAITRS